MLAADKLYLAPDVAPLEDALVVMSDGKISAVGTRGQVRVPPNASVSACGGGVVLSGFQNSHVHLLGEGLFDAKSQSDEALADALERMLTRYGFTTVVDTTSQPANTTVIRQRIETRQVRGPRILTTGAGVFPPQGLPIYISHLPHDFLEAQLMPESAEQARRVVSRNLADVADATKLFVATPQADHSLKRMALDIASAAADATHAQNRLVMVHPTDLDGVRLALAIDADVLVHTTLGSEEAWPQDVLQQLLSKRTAIAPTFKLLDYELDKQKVPDPVQQRLIEAAVVQFRPFVEAGGRVLFGTDVGYMTHYDPTEEYVLMQRAGMTPMQILASLTTHPAHVWNENSRRGRIERGMDADVVVLDADPAQDVRHFAAVKCTIRGGREIYAREKRAPAAL